MNKYLKFLMSATLAMAPCVHAADTLRGAGATFPYPLYQKWFASFTKKFPEITIDYRAIGSGSGVEALSKGEVDFAGSDVPLTDDELYALPGKVRMVPTVMGGVVPVYHLEGVLEDLQFTPEALAGIYLGKITRWDDPLIRASNRGVRLPSTRVAVIHRSDRSGTSYVWTSWLSQVSGEWKATAGQGDRVSWPVGTGASGNEGVAEEVARTPGAIGYVEFIYALQNRLNYGLVRNRAGRFLQADLITVPAAAADFARSIQSDFRLPILNAPGRDSYPIASFTYLLAPSKTNDESKNRALAAFLEWMLTSGQKQCAALGYAALPDEVSGKARNAMAH